MKFLVLASLLIMSVSSFAGEVLTCNVSPQKVIKITKENNKYFYKVNKQKLSELASAQTIQKKDLKNESLIQELMEFAGIPAAEVNRVNVYQLSQDADGGNTVVRFIFEDNTAVAGYLSMAGFMPCR